MPNPSIASVRRGDRAVTDEAWIRAFLHRAPVCAIAVMTADGPLINTNLYVYDEAAHTISFHTARPGRTRSAIEEGDGRVCFSISEMGRLLPAEHALNFSVEYAGVMVFGHARIVEEEQEAARYLQMLLDKYAPHLRPGEDYRPPVAEEIARTAVYCIEIEAWSGKRKTAPADFPGAYLYGQRPGC